MLKWKKQKKSEKLSSQTFFVVTKSEWEWVFEVDINERYQQLECNVGERERERDIWKEDYLFH
jgi:hypothetical protein